MSHEPQNKLSTSWHPTAHYTQSSSASRNTHYTTPCVGVLRQQSRALWRAPTSDEILRKNKTLYLFMYVCYKRHVLKRSQMKKKTAVALENTFLPRPLPDEPETADGLTRLLGTGCFSWYSRFDYSNRVDINGCCRRNQGCEGVTYPYMSDIYRQEGGGAVLK